jgi:hypothetical protein
MFDDPNAVLITRQVGQFSIAYPGQFSKAPKLIQARTAAGGTCPPFRVGSPPHTASSSIQAAECTQPNGAPEITRSDTLGPYRFDFLSYNGHRTLYQLLASLMSPISLIGIIYNTK